MYTYTIVRYQLTNHQIRHQTIATQNLKWAVSMASKMTTLNFLVYLWGYVWINIRTLSLLRVKLLSENN